MRKRNEGKRGAGPITGGAGHGPDKPVDQAVSTSDEEPPFALTTPDAPPISPPGTEKAFDRMREKPLSTREP